MSDLDLAAVATWMRTAVPGFHGPVSAEKFTEGQSNPTYHLRAASGDFVLRRKPPGRLLKSAHAVDREFRVQRALAGTDVPVARMHALCEEEGVIGSTFYVMDHVTGRSFGDPALPSIPMQEKSNYIKEMCRVLAAIHKVDLNTVELSDYGPRGNYYRRQIDRWSGQYRASETDRIPAMDRLIEALDAVCPEDDGRVSLVHGDYRIDNLLYHPDRAEIVAVLDWELSTIGHPFADLAAVIMQWQFPPGRQGRGLSGVDRGAEGLLSDQAFVDLYCTHMGLDSIDDFGFYVAFCFFRMAGILQGVKKRALDGNASNPEKGLQLGSFVPLCAQAGLEALG